jgi:hypothetical protein
MGELDSLRGLLEAIATATAPLVDGAGADGAADGDSDVDSSNDESA